MFPGRLADRFAAGALSPQETLSLGRQVADALEAAHEKNIIHRDLKPGNIKITPEGKVKLLDFGLAKAIANDTAPAGETASFLSTREGTVLGTPLYMSPEQVRGQPVDRRADIWAFGCVLFEALSGQRAFSGNTGPDIFAAVLEREPDWNALPPSTPAAIRILVQRCLRKDLARRLRDIGDAKIEIVDALEHGRIAEPVPLSLPAPPQRSAPRTPASTITLDRTTAIGQEIAQVQLGIFITRAKNLHRLHQWRWLLLCLFLVVCIGLMVGSVLYGALNKTDLYYGGEFEALAYSSLIGAAAAALVGFAAAWLRRKAITLQIQAITRNHPRELESWGGEANLRDPVALEALLRALQREKTAGGTP
jgi:hypothetical protein